MWFIFAFVVEMIHRQRDIVCLVKCFWIRSIALYKRAACHSLCLECSDEHRYEKCGACSRVRGINNGTYLLLELLNRPPTAADSQTSVDSINTCQTKQSVHNALKDLHLDANEVQLTEQGDKKSRTATS